MSDSQTIESLREQVLNLGTEVKHLTNELRLTKEEYDESTHKYFDIYSNLDQKVKERTADLEKANKELKREILERERAEQEKTRLEGQLRQTQKMEAIGTLAGGIAHDFNNILVAILGYAEMARDAVAPESSVRSDLNQVLKAGKRARDLVRHILTFSRQSSQELRPLQIHLIVKETLKLMRATIPSTIQIRRNINAEPTIKGDPTQIHQVIMNLCTNAAHAMDKNGGQLEVCVDTATLVAGDLLNESEKTPGDYMVLTVKDTGTGMSQNLLKRIFDPYFTTKEFGKGSGMGLAVVHGIVKSHGGRITVTSEPGQGSTFKVFLPRIEESEMVIEDYVYDALPTGNENILFVDDEWTGADLGKKILEGLGYTVTSRTSSIEALEAFRAQQDKFDLVITDQTMPNMTGAELAREILKTKPDMPIILCTGYSARISDAKAKSIGITEFAMKPLARRELAEKVRQVLDSAKS